MSDNDLIAAGFREYKSCGPHDRAFQLRETDQSGIRYFVNVRFWKHSKYKNGIDSWDSNVQFTDKNGVVFNIERLRTMNDTPLSILEWYQKLWERLCCQHYRLNDE